MMNLKRAKRAYIDHKVGSRNRGILFLFSFEEWVGWWEDNLGPDWQSLRGVGHGKYCMARKGDSGPYSPENVDCKGHVENSREGNLGKKWGSERKIAASKSRQGMNRGATNAKAKLTEAMVIKIFHAKGTNKEIAKKYNVNDRTVSNIKLKKNWTHVIGDL